MKSAVISADHGIIFIIDPTNKDVVVPEYSEDEIVSATDSCISVAVRPYMDGDVEVLLGDTDAAVDNLYLVASHSLMVPNGIVAIATADVDRVLDQEVSPGIVNVSVWVDSDTDVARVLVVIGSALSGDQHIN